MFNMHLHVTSWSLSIILFIATWLLLKQNKQQIANVLHNINRIVFLVILYTGGMLIYRYTQAPVWDNYGVEAIVKALAGVYLIFLMEWFVIRNKKGAASRGLMVQFVVVLVIVLVLGFGRLPWGFLP
ncbi:YisL family protein [Amphibacillus indicireducens]|uniref:YisL family protein n=2 Tax=Amphibacillus indicireducens TaxID=1076330 RepID=A0ABP7VS08_9BACI